MVRKNIFEMLAEQNNIKKDIERIDTLFDSEPLLIDEKVLEDYTLKHFVDMFCFENWKNRKRCINLQDFLDSLQYDEFYDYSSAENLDAAFIVIEIIFNCWKMAEKYIREHNGFKCYTKFNNLYEIMVDILSQYNHKAVYDEEHEQVLIIEDLPELTAVVETVEPGLSFEIIRYHHYSMRGNIAQKKAILLAMGNKMEPNRTALSEINKDLEDDIFFMLNNLNLRHNNCIESDKHYKEFVARMDKNIIEEWYDELYHMMLLAFLSLNHIDRHLKIKELRKSVNKK